MDLPEKRMDSTMLTRVMMCFIHKVAGGLIMKKRAEKKTARWYCNYKGARKC